MNNVLKDYLSTKSHKSIQILLVVLYKGVWKFRTLLKVLLN